MINQELEEILKEGGENAGKYLIIIYNFIQRCFWCKDKN